MAYRDIKPTPTFESDAHPLQRRQFHWVKQSEGLETALFAGKEMTICLNEDGCTYKLTFLDMANPDLFRSIEEAKEAAHDFARAVLLTMLQYVGVREEDHSLRQCLTMKGQ